MEVTNNSTSGVVIWDPVHQDEIIVDAAGATYAAGTLLGRITANNQLTAYTSGASDGSEVPLAVLQDELVLAAATPVPCRPIVSGRVRQGDLVAHGVGAITKAEADALRNFTIIPQAVSQLSELDNQ